MTLSKRSILILALISLVSFGLYLAYSYFQIGTFSFPLDDAWIHQTYARNLAQYGEWAYIPGKTSGGSTSPLWTLMLSLAHVTKTDPFLGTYLLSFLLFTGAGVVYQSLSENLSPEKKGQQTNPLLPIFGIFFLLEWHMNWAAVSGMEIMLYIFMLLLFYLVLVKYKKPFLLGVFIGVSLWIRPDAITLLGPLYFVLVLADTEKSQKIKGILIATASFLPILIGYLVFNRLTAGTWLPNTFFAKQSEYAVLYQTGLLTRAVKLLLQPWIGPAILLLPGMIYSVVLSIQKRNWVLLSMFLWAVGYVLIYAVRLPVIYQHARYLMPTMPIFYFLGLYGTISALNLLNSDSSRSRLVKFGVTAAVSILVIGFWFLGMNAFYSDGAIIHEEMVETSRWVSENIPEGQVIAAHDIGALGYYGNHDILDLAGLISPDVISFISDEDKLLEFLQTSQVIYLMTLSDWYSSLTDTAEVVYLSSGEAIVKQGGAPMGVYVYNWSGE